MLASTGLRHHPSRCRLPWWSALGGALPTLRGFSQVGFLSEQGQFGQSSTEYNPYTYAVEIRRFLAEEPAMLDLGYSRKLQQEAREGRSEAESLDYMASEAVQGELRDVIVQICANSLSAERMHNFAKKSDSRSPIDEHHRHWAMLTLPARPSVRLLPGDPYVFLMALGTLNAFL